MRSLFGLALRKFLRYAEELTAPENMPVILTTDGNFMTAETIEKMAHDFLANKRNA